MAAMQQLEARLDNVFDKNAPKLPANAKKTLVAWAPWVALVVGILTLWAAWALWSWANVANDLINYTNTLCATYAGTGCDAAAAASRMNLWIWVGIAVLLAEGILYLLAFPGLRAHKRAGWNYLYWGALINVAYAVISLVAGYGITNFFGSLIGSAIGFWLLFQVRSSYSNHA